jgi:hypothetical protein
VQTEHSVTRPLDHLTTKYPISATIPNLLHQVSYFCHDPRRCTPCHTYHLHHETSKCDSPNKTKIKVKQSKYPIIKFKPRQVNDSSQSNQGTDHLVFQSPLWCVHWQQKVQSLKFESKTHDAQLEDQKPTKNSRRSSRRGKNHNTNKRHKKRQTKEKSKENLKIRKLNTPPEINSP